MFSPDANINARSIPNKKYKVLIWFGIFAIKKEKKTGDFTRHVKVTLYILTVISQEIRHFVAHFLISN